MTDVLTEARETTNRVARTFSIACRLLPRDIRDDVYCLYLVFRTLDDLVDEGQPEADERVAAVEHWATGGNGVAPSREVAILRDLESRHPLPRHALRDFCAGMRFDLGGGANRTEEDLDRYCYQVAGSVAPSRAAIVSPTVPATW